MKLILLSREFYIRYSSCKEILRKENRPYVSVEIRIDDVLYAVPFRHHIKHKNAFITYDECGLDFSKAVVIESDLYISDQTPRVDTREWNIIKSSQNKIIFEFKKFLRQYKRALKNPDNPRSRSFLRYCSLQYFEIPTPCKQTVAKCNHLNR